ncbi:MAG: MarR family transcriptional regulator [Candidatus Thermoplasmatota archaeon]|nr:MarR family transcriptional regulator [Candidatus Thermoplasmatota archaeon]
MDVGEIEKVFEEMTYELMLYREEIMKLENISLSGFFVLSTLSSTGPMKSSELAIRLNVTKPSISRIIDNLELKNLIEREYGKEDRRVVYIRLSPKGREVQERIYNVKVMTLRALAESDPKSMENFLLVMRKLSKSIHEKRKRTEKNGRYPVR